MAGLLFSICIVGVGSVVGRKTLSGTVIKTRLTQGARTAASPALNKVLADLKSISQREQIDFKLLERDSIARDLIWAGMRSPSAIQTAEHLIRLSAILPLVAIGSLMVVAPPSSKTLLIILACGGMAYLLIRKSVRAMREKRQAKIEKDLPQFLDLLVACVESGQNFTSAIQTLVQELDPRRPLIQEFMVMHQEYLGGITMGEASDRLCKRCGVLNLTAVLGNIVQTEKIGTSLGQTLRILAHEIRDKRKQSMRETAGKMPAKAVFPTTLIFLALMLVLIGPALLDISKALGKTDTPSSQTQGGG